MEGYGAVASYNKEQQNKHRERESNEIQENNGSSEGIQRNWAGNQTPPEVNMCPIDLER